MVGTPVATPISTYTMKLTQPYPGVGLLLHQPNPGHPARKHHSDRMYIHLSAGPDHSTMDIPWRFVEWPPECSSRPCVDSNEIRDPIWTRANNLGSQRGKLFSAPYIPILDQVGGGECHDPDRATKVICTCYRQVFEVFRILACSSNFSASLKHRDPRITT